MGQGLGRWGANTWRLNTWRPPREGLIRGVPLTCHPVYMLGEYVARRVVGRDDHPELAAIFALKAGSF